MKNFLKTLSLILGALLIITSCSNDEVVNEASEQQQITIEEVSKNLDLIEASNFVDKLISDKSKDLYDNSRIDNQNFNDCIDFEFNFPTSYSLTFNDCDINGNMISGKISVGYSRDLGTVTSVVTFEDFVFNDSSINGNKTTVLDSSASSFTVTSNLEMTSGTDTATINGTSTFEFAFDNGVITSSSTGDWNTTINDDSYSISTETPLVALSSCRYAVSGVLTISENSETTSVNYGDGECDNLATLTLPDGTIVEIEL